MRVAWKAFVMRLLIVGGTSLMAWVIRHLVPEDVEVMHATTLDEVTTILRLRPPKAALFHGNPSTRPWSEVHRLCHTHEPPIPTLFHPCTYLEPDEMRHTDCADDYCPKPLPACELRRQIYRLLGLDGEAEAGETSPGIGEKPAEPLVHAGARSP